MLGDVDGRESGNGNGVEGVSVESPSVSGGYLLWDVGGRGSGNGVVQSSSFGAWLSLSTDHVSLSNDAEPFIAFSPTNITCNFLFFPFHIHL